MSNQAPPIRYVAANIPVATRPMYRLPVSLAVRRYTSQRQPIELAKETNRRGSRLIPVTSETTALT